MPMKTRRSVRIFWVATDKPDPVMEVAVRGGRAVVDALDEKWTGRAVALQDDCNRNGIAARGGKVMMPTDPEFLANLKYMFSGHRLFAGDVEDKT